MRKTTCSTPVFSMGIDLGDRNSDFVVLTREGELVREGKIPTNREGFARLAEETEPGTRVILEVGTHSSWINDLLLERGFEVIVANSLNAGLAMRANGKKNDRADALTLAGLGFGPIALLRPIRHRRREARQDLAVVRARCQLVEARTKLVNAVRGLVKADGERLPGSSTPSFSRKARERAPAGLKPALEPVLATIDELSRQIRVHDKTIEQLGEKYPETRKLRKIHGVGSLTAVAFVLTLDDPSRFERSRTVGAYFGLTPRQHESGDTSLQLKITRCGDEYMRQLLVNCAQYILGSFGKPCDLRSHGERIGARGGPRGKKRGVVAVARKLAVVMHHLLVSAEEYDPFHLEERPSRRRKSA